MSLITRRLEQIDNNSPAAVDVVAHQFGMSLRR